MKAAGARDEIMKDIYSGTETSYRTPSGISTPHVAVTIVKQSDPVSGVLFITTVNFILRKIQREWSDRDLDRREILHYILTYADDMPLLVKSTGDLQALLHLINVLDTKVERHLNPKNL